MLILGRGRKLKKAFLLEELAKEDLQVLALAYSCAKHLTIYGVDVMKPLLTATENEFALEKAYQKGYYDAMHEVNSMKKFESDKDIT